MTKESIKIEFKYEDLLGNVTESRVERVNSTLEDSFEPELSVLLEAFKSFLIACAFSEEQINTRIQ